MTIESAEKLGTTASAKRNVYVTDDEVGIRLSVWNMLDAIGYAGWSFASGADLLGALGEIEAGCLLIDIQMPGMTGLDVMRALNERDCHWPVIVMTARGDVPVAVQAMKLGAIDFIEKPFSPDILKSALDRGFAKWDEGRLHREKREAAVSKLKILTERERSVLDALVEGKQNKIVAHDLGLSVRTVEMHRANLLTKLGLRTPQEAAALVLRAMSGSETPALPAG